MQESDDDKWTAAARSFGIAARDGEAEWLRKKNKGRGAWSI
jgi:hypothetical protein